MTLLGDRFVSLQLLCDFLGWSETWSAIKVTILSFQIFIYLGRMLSLEGVNLHSLSFTINLWCQGVRSGLLNQCQLWLSACKEVQLSGILSSPQLIASLLGGEKTWKISFNAVTLNSNLAEALDITVPMSFKLNCWIQHSPVSFYRPQAHASANYKDSRLRQPVLCTCWAEKLCPIFWGKGGTALIHYKDSLWLW